MRHTILVSRGVRTGRSHRSPTEGRLLGAYRAYTEALRAAGVMVGGAGLQPPRAATTLRQSHGKRHVQDGPFVETKSSSVATTSWTC